MRVPVIIKRVLHEILQNTVRKKRARMDIVDEVYFILPIARRIISVPRQLAAILCYPAKMLGSASKYLVTRGETVGKQWYFLVFSVSRSVFSRVYCCCTTELH